MDTCRLTNIELVTDDALAIMLTEWAKSLIANDRIDIRVIGPSGVMLRFYRDGKLRSFPQYMMDAIPFGLGFNEMSGMARVVLESRKVIHLDIVDVVDAVEKPKKKKAKKAV